MRSVRITEETYFRGTWGTFLQIAMVKLFLKYFKAHWTLLKKDLYVCTDSKKLCFWIRESAALSGIAQYSDKKVIFLVAVARML